MKVIAEVVKVRGECSAGLKVGDKLVFTSEQSPSTCPWALGAMLPPAMVLLNGGRFPWAGADEPADWCCPDPTNTVVFRLMRTDV